MPRSEELELLPEGDDQFTPFFETDEQYQQFRERYAQAVSEDLERLAEARRRSEQEARQRLLR